MRALSLIVLLATAVAAWDRNCISQPVGFGAGTTGGKGGETVEPKTTLELQNALCGNIDTATKTCKDTTARTIVIGTTFIFDEGTINANGVAYSNCAGSGQYCYPAFSTACKGATSISKTFTMNKAGTTQMIVGSNKSIIGKNGKGVIKGKGLVVRKASNVIIQDIAIQDINPQVVWGGDGLSLEDASKVWVHQVTFRNIGRMMLRTGGTTNTGITVSSCFFDGNTKYAAYCDGSHYWNFKFYAKFNEVTMINNNIESTSGRSPDAGGIEGGTTYVHLIGNYYNKNTNHAIEPKVGANILAEGNKFVNVKNVWETSYPGGLFLADSNNDAKKCQNTLGVACSLNSYTGSKVTAKADESVLNAFASRYKSAVVSARSISCKL